MKNKKKNNKKQKWKENSFKMTLNIYPYKFFVFFTSSFQVLWDVSYLFLITVQVENVGKKDNSSNFS